MTFSKERLEELKKLVETTNIVDLYPREQKFMQAAALLPQYIEALRNFPSNRIHGGFKSKLQLDREIAEWAVKNQSALHTLSQPQREG